MRGGWASGYGIGWGVFGVDVLGMKLVQGGAGDTSLCDSCGGRSLRSAPRPAQPSAGPWGLRPRRWCDERDDSGNYRSTKGHVGIRVGVV